MGAPPPPKSAGLPGITRPRVGLPLKIFDYTLSSSSSPPPVSPRDCLRRWRLFTRRPRCDSNVQALGLALESFACSAASTQGNALSCARGRAARVWYSTLFCSPVLDSTRQYCKPLYTTLFCSPVLIKSLSSSSSSSSTRQYSTVMQTTLYHLIPINNIYSIPLYSILSYPRCAFHGCVRYVLCWSRAVFSQLLDKGRFGRERRGRSSSAISIVNKPPSLPPYTCGSALLLQGWYQIAHILYSKVRGEEEEEEEEKV